MVKFLSIRVFTFSAILFLASLLMGGSGLEFPVGILIGSFASIYKLRLYTLVLTALPQNGKNTYVKSLFLNFFYQVLSLGILVVTVIVDTHLFFGVAAGLVSTSIVICLNGLTEKIGLTHNNWQDIFK